MIDFSRSTFTWKSFPWKPDPWYKYVGGFVGNPGAVHHVRFNLEASCQIRNENGGVTALFVGAPCRTEYTIVERNLFQIPNGEFRFAFSHTHEIPIAREPSDRSEDVAAVSLNERFQEHQIALRKHDNVEELSEPESVIAATLTHDLLNARSTYHDAERGLSVTVEYPINLINLNVEEKLFQVCTGPLILPDLATWDGQKVQRVFLAHAAFTQFDHVEFILRREVAAAAEERFWLDRPRGRDRFELHDSSHRPPDGPPERPRPTVYNETWALEGSNVILRASNEATPQ